MLHIFISNRPGHVKPGSSGKPVPGYETRLVDEHGEPVVGASVYGVYDPPDFNQQGAWNSTRRTTADDSGQVLLPNIEPNRTFRLFASKSGLGATRTRLHEPGTTASKRCT